LQPNTTGLKTKKNAKNAINSFWTINIQNYAQGKNIIFGNPPFK